MVSKRQELFDRSMADRVHVGVDNGAAFDDFVEIEAPRDPILATMLVTQCMHSGNGSSAVISGRGNRQYVQDRLGGKPWDGGAANVMDF